MRKITVQLGLVVAILALATTSHARIFVKIQDSVGNIVDGSDLNQFPDPGNGLPARKNFFNVWKFSPALSDQTVDETDALPLLSCSPCTVYFPSGLQQRQTSPVLDTFAFTDTNTVAPFARVVKQDFATSADAIRLRGVKITSLVAGITLTLTYSTQALDLRTVFSTPYPATAAMSGSFRTALGARATACGDGTTSSSVGAPCVKLQIKVNGTTVDGQGTSAIATAAVPCNSAFPTTNPCGTGGTWSSTGSFTGVNDTANMDCPVPCVPNSRGILTAIFNGANETLTLAASAHGAFANQSSQKGGLEEVALTLADELGDNRWVPYTAATQRCRAVPKAPTTNDTRNITNKSNLPISFEEWCGILGPLPVGAGLDLVSIVDASEVKSSGAANTMNDSARMGFVAGVGDLAVKDITTLSFDYDVVVSPPLSSSGNTNLGNLSFIDCTAGAIRVEFELLDRMTLAPLGTARLYLGNDSATQFRSGCAAFDPSDLVNNQAARVDLSALFGNLAKPCCDTFKSFQTGQTGQAIVRKLALVVDHGVGVPLTPCSPSNGSACANYKVTFYDANVNGVTARSSLQVVTNVTRITDLVPDGVSIVITKLSDPSVPANTLPKVVKVIQNPPEGSGLPPLIVINGAKFTSSVKVVDIEANSGATYAFNLCLNSAEISAENPLTAGVARGICIPDQGIATLK